MVNKYLWGSIIFFIGCLFNLVDSITYRRNILIISSAILFVIGSIFFIYDAYNKIEFDTHTKNIINSIKYGLDYKRTEAEIGAYKLAQKLVPINRHKKVKI
tara:strand:+ start:639 stop:941 length:303 start_codon:yes stop_codon:yes gene_type:complete